MIRSSKGVGGPQPSEVARRMAAQEAQLEADKAWLERKRAALRKVSKALDIAFEKLQR